MAALASSSRLDLSTAKQHKKSFRSSLSETIRNATSTAAKSKARIAPPDDASRSKGKGRSVDLSPAAVAAALANDDTMKKSTGFLRRLDSKMTFHKRKSADPPPRADIPPPADYGGYVVPSLSRGSMSSPTLHRLANGHADGGNAPSIHALISAPKARRPLIASTRHDPSASTRRRSSSPPTPLAPSPRPSRVRPAIPPSPSTPVLGSYPDPSPRRASAPASRPSVPPLPPPVAFAEPSSPKSGSNSSRRTTRSPTRVSRSPPPPSQSQSQSQFTPSSSPGSGRTLNHARRNSQPVFGTTTIRGSPSPSQSPPSSPSPGPSRFRPARTHSTSPSPHSPHLPSTRPLSGSGFALSPTREAIRSASSFLVKETARAPASMPSDVWLEVEQRMTPLVRMERVWGKSGGAGGEERERRTFCDTLRDGYVLCQ
ncbi:hypothetical protein BOTBODRAFT_438284 [Botryobasidium botryosum FD-172 SS1]|uniref:Uncharacterized protein n=1 Tax=Botryobasidium botryosum (strain FD-172 SS1) TaxID=930990 RepID=A0A067MUJ2_BOTB1|nr:hypothetical protein BOTBODRAFT_438284 [Botryobasidium botryosum FD-172 SS1]